MTRYGYKQQKHCRWCGTEYYAVKPHNKDGFDKPACKQAHYRAYKKWVITKGYRGSRAPGKRVTQKKSKRRT